MAELGQIIVNRVKPLLDTANNAGYETGYGNGFDSGYVSGEESVREYVDAQVEISKKAIIGRGGNISSDAGLEDLPNAIFNIPADASLAHYTDTEIAYRKSVPVGAEKYALLKSIGGMTYKSNNLLPFPYLRNNGIENGVNFSTTNDGAISLSGTSTYSDVSNIALIDKNAPITFEAGTYTFRQYRSNNDTNARMVWVAKEEGANSQYLYEDVVKTFSKKFTLWCAVQIKSGATVNATFKPMFYKGTATLPYERYYEGLRDSKVTEILNHGKNFLPPEALIADNWVNYEGNKYVYQLNLPDGWYCMSLKLKAGATDTTLYLQGNKSDVGYTVTSSCYNGNGTIIGGYLATGNKLDNSAVWFKVDNGAGKTYRFYSLHLRQSRLDNLYDVQIERANLTKEPSSSYPPATYAPPTEYTPYREPISYSIPKEIQALEGYGKEGFNIDVKKQQYTYGEIAGKLPVKLDGFIEVESGGTLEFVNEYKNAVPSTVKYTIKVGS